MVEVPNRAGLARRPVPYRAAVLGNASSCLTPCSRAQELSNRGMAPHKDFSNPLWRQTTLRRSAPQMSECVLPAPIRPSHTHAALP